MTEDCAAKLRWIRTSNHNLSLAVNAELRYGSRAVFQFEIRNRAPVDQFDPQTKERPWIREYPTAFAMEASGCGSTPPTSQNLMSIAQSTAMLRSEIQQNSD